MRHARADYNRFQDPEGLIPEDEPVMLFRGQDPAAPAALEAYAVIAEAVGSDATLVSIVRSHAQSMRDWQKLHSESVHPADL